MPWRLRERADGVDLEGYLRGPDQGKFWQGAGRFCFGQSAQARPADRPPVLGAGGRADHAEGSNMRRAGAIAMARAEEAGAVKDWRHHGLAPRVAAAVRFP